MTPDQINAVYDILVEEAGAEESERSMFLNGRWPASHEYRFRGSLGQGGKVFWARTWIGGRLASERAIVDCYSEDLTPEREAIIKRTNERLAKLMENAK